MSSRAEKRWVQKEQPEAEKVATLAAELKINPIIANILCQRGICTYNEAFAFFRPKIEHLHDPFLMQDMAAAVNRLTSALAKQEKLLIYGDYDVDGTTSVALVYGILANYFTNIEFYIPDRFTEGYGVSKQGVEWAHQNGCSLIIALDCGIKSADKVAYATELGIDFIICDHHLPEEYLPKAVAVLDPKRTDCPYPYKELSGCGIGFKFMQAFCEQNSLCIEKLYSYLDLVVVSIAADIVPITGENRILAYYGLEVLNRNERPGLVALKELAGIKGDMEISQIVFGFAPRINAAGRLGDAKRSVEMLLAQSVDDAFAKAEIIDETNRERRTVDTHITREALEMIEQDEFLRESSSTVLYKEDWQKGVVGIVASRCIEKYYRPTIILTHSNELATGSARSVVGFDLYSALSECSDLLEQFGGHMYAAGLTLKPENVEKFRLKFEEVVARKITTDQRTPQIEVDAVLPLSMITPGFYKIINQMAPFGPGNMQPVFVTEGVQDTGDSRVVGENHLKLSLYQNGRMAEGIAFGMADYYAGVASGRPFDVCYCIEENHFRGTVTLQLKVKDIKFRVVEHDL